MNERIRELRKLLHMSQHEFAETIGLKQNTVAVMEKANATITNKNIKTICLLFGVNEKWLVEGKGKVFVRENRNQEELIELFENLPSEYQDFLLKEARNLNILYKLTINTNTSFNI